MGGFRHRRITLVDEALIDLKPVRGFNHHMTEPMLYLSFPGNAREALEFYADIFGGNLQLHTYAEFARTDGPADAIDHGVLSGGPVSLFGSDAAPGDVPVRIEGAMLSLLGTAEPNVLHSWFDRLGEGGTVLDPLVPKPWGASDGQVIDRHGLRWLIGYEPTSKATLTAQYRHLHQAASRSTAPEMWALSIDRSCRPHVPLWVDCC